MLTPALPAFEPPPLLDAGALLSPHAASAIAKTAPAKPATPPPARVIGRDGTSALTECAAWLRHVTRTCMRLCRSSRGTREVGMARHPKPSTAIRVGLAVAILAVMSACGGASSGVKGATSGTARVNVPGADRFAP